MCLCTHSARTLLGLQLKGSSWLHAGGNSLVCRRQHCTEHAADGIQQRSPPGRLLILYLVLHTRKRLSLKTCVQTAFNGQGGTQASAVTLSSAQTAQAAPLSGCSQGTLENGVCLSEPR